jgi:hypothetical protein
MKKIISLLTFFALSLSVLYAQSEQTERPYSFSQKNISQVIDVQVMPSVDLQKLEREDAEVVDKSAPLRAGVGFSVNHNLLNAGRTDVTADGGTLWRTKYVSEGSIMTYVVFEQFDIPKEAKLFVYSPDREQVYGPYTNDDVQSVGRFESDNIIGDELIVEYYEPADASFRGHFQIAAVMHTYRDFLDINSDAKGPHGDAEGDCHIDVACPDAQPWHYPINSVVFLSMTAYIPDEGWGMFLCTGAMVNNVRMDKTPYVLSADHCVSADDQTFKFYFNYQLNECGGTTGISSRVANGGTIVARSNATNTYASSDFLLVKITGNLGIAYRDSIFFAGWDRSGAFSVGTCIHHPGGDWKKISFVKSISAPTTGSYANKFFVVSWLTNPNKGVTEQGSSGSPLFNSHGLIIGTLTGGSSYCYYPTGKDNYGRMSYHWTNNNNSNAARKLQPWLDPDNTGATSLKGMLYTGEIITSVEDYAQSSTFQVIPNPVRDGIVTIQGEFYNENATCRIYNALGQLVMTQRIQTDASFTMNVKGLDNGIYFVDIQGSERNYKSKMIIAK